MNEEQEAFTYNYTEKPQSPSGVPEYPPRPYKRRRPRRGMGAGGVVVLCLVCAVLSGLIGAGTAYLTMRDGDTLFGEALDDAFPTPLPEITTTAAAEGAVNDTAAYIYSLACRQVVGITSEITYYNIFGQTSAASVSGSGIVISEDGYILTNYHVIEDAYVGGYQVSVMLYGGQSYEAEIIGFDADTDLALLKTEAEGLSAAELGATDGLTVGQLIYAVGNPLGELNYTMTGGIVSATDRTITTESDVAVNMFQIDAAVNSGNSGGPVYNTEGQVIGVVTAKYSETGVEGIGFAIPITDAAEVANQLLQYGYVTGRASLSLSPATVTPTAARYYGMIEGVYVNAVTSGGAAYNAGIREGDIITAVDGAKIADTSELTATVKQYHAGDAAVLTLWRNGKNVDVTVIFDERLPEEDTVHGQTDTREDYRSYGMEDLFREFFGF